MPIVQLPRFIKNNRSKNPLFRASGLTSDVYNATVVEPARITYKVAQKATTLAKRRRKTLLNKLGKALKPILEEQKYKSGIRAKRHILEGELIQKYERKQFRIQVQEVTGRDYYHTNRFLVSRKTVRLHTEGEPRVSQAAYITQTGMDMLYNVMRANFEGSPGNYYRVFLEFGDAHTVSTALQRAIISREAFEGLFQRLYDSPSIYNITMTMIIAEVPIGAGMLEKKDFPLHLQKRGLSLIFNDDGCCGQRCLVLAEMPRESKKEKDAFSNMRKPQCVAKFDSKTAEMCTKIGVAGPMTFPDFDKWADITETRVIILSQSFTQVYSTEQVYEKQIYIYHDREAEHYHFINDINAFSNDSHRNRKWCTSCHESFKLDTGAFKSHKCKASACHYCKVQFYTAEKLKAHQKCQWQICGRCNVRCPCIEAHTKICKGDMKKCNKCLKFTHQDHFDEHKCGEKKCRVCSTYYMGEHRCFIQGIEPKESDEVIGDIYAYDFESMFVGANKEHVVNLAIASKLFADEVHAYANIEEFCNYILTKKNCTFIAHNAKAYDAWMVHAYLIKHTGKRPTKLILAGNKIMYMKIGSVRFVDSLNHIAQSLASFPKTFGFTELKKGHFPYEFSTPENQNYVGPIPDMAYFKPDEMKSDTREDFMKWYPLQTGEYDFAAELKAYCLSDVDILKRAMEIYITDSIEVNHINPLQCTTIASMAMRVYKTHHYKEDSICVLTKEESDFCRRAFYGGRTEVFQTHVALTEEQLAQGARMDYIDITSLYPTVQFYDDLISGACTWDEPSTDINVVDYLKEHIGFAECDVICPVGLHIPVLPEHKSGKLLFDLAPKTNAVYTSVELLRAISVGYVVTIKKCLYFERSKDLFKDYIKGFIAIKTQAGWKGKEEDKDAFILDFYSKSGLHLDKDKMKFNPGMKALAKILLNSLWGKFGQSDKLPCQEYLTTADAWFRLLEKQRAGKIELKRENVIDANTMFVVYIDKEDSSTRENTNVGLAAFIASQARLRLHEELQKLDTRVVYCDTDSIIYRSYGAEGEYHTPQGACLGEWEAETNSVIVEVLAIAPKTYGYRCADGSGDVKCKGITLNHNNSKKFDLNTLRQLENGTITTVHTTKMEFVRKNGKINTKMGCKVIKYDKENFKRTLNGDGTTSAKV
jgi:hypothetical protein